MTSRPHRVIALIPLTLTIALGGVALHGAPRAAETAATDPEASAPHTPAASAIEKAFTRNDASHLRSALPRRGKVYLSSRTLGIKEGYYGSEQLVAVLDGIFRSRPTRRFTWEPPRSPPKGRPVTLTAVWRYRPKDGSKSSTRLNFVVAPGKEGWAVREIRESN